MVPKIVNIVASGSLSREFDLETVSNDFGDIAEYDPEKYPGMYIRFDDNSPLITLYRTGKYIVTGSSSTKNAYSMRDRFLSELNNKGMIDQQKDEWFKIQNIVFTAELNHSVDLNTLAITLGFETTEYEPEQFPGLIYRPIETDVVILIFASGRVVLTGNTDKKIVSDTLEELVEKLNNTSSIAE